MKRLEKLKWFAWGAVFLLGMNSCLKSSDKGFQFGVGAAYMLQTGSDENASFEPVIRIYAYEPFKNAIAKCNGTSYYFAAANTAKTVMDMQYMGAATDSIPVGDYQITASNAEDETAALSVNFAIDKRLGELKVSKIDDTVSDGIVATWDTVQNASAYYLLWRTKEDRVWQITQWKNVKSAGEGSYTGTYDFTDYEKGAELYVAVGATYRLLLKASRPVLITLGENPVPEPSE